MAALVGDDSHVDDKQFASLISEDVRPFLERCVFSAHKANRKHITNRSFLGDLNNIATRLEELLDAYGAKHNAYWFGFREHVAVAKIFTSVAYTLLLISNQMPKLKLDRVKADFTEATNRILEGVADILECNSESVVSMAGKLGFEIPVNHINRLYPPERSHLNKLKADRKKRKLKAPGRTILYLATAFLEIADESDVLEIRHRVRPCDYPDCIPNDIGEEKLMVIENKFHSLQSLYDTYLSESDIEDHDDNLITLRSHISIIYPLLYTATLFSHFYERHIDVYNKGLKTKFHCPIKPKELLEMLMEYSVTFAHEYIGSATKLCRFMISQYSTRDRIRVQIPVYRGFHVRPSTMIAKIIKHYGGKVMMRMMGDEYNAASPLELFRANEKINARKRKVLGEEILKVPAVHKIHDVESDEEMQNHMKVICMELMERRKLILYEKDFSCEGVKYEEGESIPEYIKRWLANCLAAGKIDIWLDHRVEFVGDSRVLDDIKLLAEHGYGEDSYGNNIVLPKKLAYLRR